MVPVGLTSNRGISIPNKSGTLALTTDIPSISTYFYKFTTTFSNTNASQQFTDSKVDANSIIVGMKVAGEIATVGGIASHITQITYNGSHKFTITRDSAASYGNAEVTIIFMGVSSL